MISDAGVAPASRRRDNSSSSRIHSKIFHLCSRLKLFSNHFKLSLWLTSFDGASKTCSRERRRLPASLLPYPLLKAFPKLVTEKSFEPICSSFTKSEICLLNSPRPKRSRSIVKASDFISHRNPLSAAPTPPRSFMLARPDSSGEQPWLQMLWLPSPPSVPVTKMEASKLTLICLVVSLIGLGPLSQWMKSGPTTLITKSIYKGCGPLHILAWPRFVFKYLFASPPTMMSRYSISLNGLSLLLRLISTSLVRYSSQRLRVPLGKLSRSISEEPFCLKISFVFYFASIRPFNSYMSVIIFIVSNLKKHMTVTVTVLFRKHPTSIYFFLFWIQLSPKKATHWISLTAGDNPGPLLASCLVSMSRTHGNVFFWAIVSSEIFSRFGSSSISPSYFSLMFSFGLIGRGLPSCLEMTSLNWPCEYLLQTMLLASSLVSLDENLNSLTVCLVPARLEYMALSSTSQCLLTWTIHHLPELIVNVVSTYLGLVCNVVLSCSRFRVLLDLLSIYLSLLPLSPILLSMLFQALFLAKTLNFVSFLWE